MAVQKSPGENGATMRLTAHRRAILKIFETAVRPLAVDEIHARLPEADLVTVYRNVERLVGAGIIRVVRFRDDKVRYELLKRGHHHHVVCESCGLIDELPACSMVHEKSVAAQATSFRKVTDHSLEYFGICKKCS